MNKSPKETVSILKELTPGETINILKELARDWESGELTSDSSMIVLSILVNNSPPSEACIRWAEQVIERLGEEE